MNQRISFLTFTQSGDRLTTTIPSQNTIVPPGDYMLFILDGTGVPSHAKMLTVG
jgi:galactose oxidase